MYINSERILAQAIESLGSEGVPQSGWLRWPRFARIDSGFLSLEFTNHRLEAIRANRSNITKVDLVLRTDSQPATEGVRQKKFGKKVTKKVTEASEKVTKSGKRVPKTKKSDRTPSADLLLRRPEIRAKRSDPRVANCRPV